jgi:hypothetical protein
VARALQLGEGRPQASARRRRALTS